MANTATFTGRLSVIIPIPPVPWYLSGGISAANCLAAYQAKGASNLAASYVNLANPGTYDATLGVAPTWDATNGWIGSATTYLKTGIVPAPPFSVIARFSDATAEAILGVWTDTGCIDLMPNVAGSAMVDYADWQSWSTSPGKTSGTFAVFGNNIYLNGLSVGTVDGIISGSAELYILAINDYGENDYNFPGKVQAVAIYNAVITSDQALALHTAMMAL